MSDPRWVGLDVGATKILATVVGGDGRAIGSCRIATHRDDGVERVIDRCVAGVATLAERFGPPSAVGVGFAGLVDAASGRVSSSIMLPGWDGVPLAETLTGRLDVPVVVDNDANVAAWGEYVALGRPRGLNLALLTVGTGIGGALILGGRPYRGASGTAAEFGNTSIDAEGERCWCGNRGCLNTVASGTAIDRALADGVPDAVEHAARALGVGVANLLNALNPDRIVLTGGVIDAHPTFVDTVRDEAGRRAFAEPFAHATIATSTLGYSTGAFGAACAARDRAEAIR